MGNSVAKCVILLDRPTDTEYGPNDTVSGQCIVDIDRPIPLSQLSIKLVGKARTEWLAQQTYSSTDPMTGKTKHRYETSSNVCQHNCLSLKHYPGNEYSSILSPGQHNIGFKFQLPADGLPSTFDGQYGHIKYWIEAHLRKSELFTRDDRPRMPILVRSSAQWSLEELSQPVVNSKIKTVGLLNGQPVQLRCEIHRMGHSVGSDIPVQCFIDNQSDKQLSLKAVLKHNVIFRATGDQRTSSVKLVRLVNSPVTIGAHQQYTETLILTVPANLALVPMIKCPIIESQYLVSVQLKIAGSLNLNCELPVILTASI